MGEGPDVARGKAAELAPGLNPRHPGYPAGQRCPGAPENIQAAGHVWKCHGEATARKGPWVDGPVDKEGRLIP